MKINSEAEMIDLAKRIAPFLQAGDAICLHGALGVGKSVFARALIRSLCEDDDMDVPSPSFTLVQTYETDALQILHMDAYRLSGADEVIELGWPEILADHIAIIEWPDRLEDLTPSRRIDMHIDDLGGDEREIKIKQLGEWTWSAPQI